MKQLKWNEAKEIIKTGKFLLEFTTSWCGDCKVMDPVVKEVEKQLKSIDPSIQIIQVDAEEANLFRTIDKYKVLKVPSFYKVVDGIETHIGYEYLPAEKIINEYK